METHETYVSIETAKLLKQAGFDWEIDTFYQRYYEGDGHDNSIPTEEFVLHNADYAHCSNWNNTPLTNLNGILHRLSAPTLEVAQKWLREVKNCQIEIMYMYDKYGINMGKYIGIYTVQDRIHTSLADEKSEQPIKLFEVYEKAQEALEQKILTILLEEEQQNEETNLV